jgi:hypothetical protein
MIDANPATRMRAWAPDVNLTNAPDGTGASNCLSAEAASYAVRAARSRSYGIAIGRRTKAGDSAASRKRLRCRDLAHAGAGCQRAAPG